MTIFKITNKKDGEVFTKELKNEEEARHFVINNLDLSKEWTVTRILTHDQRKKAIEIIINDDLEQCYKHRDRFTQLYEGILPYKNMSSSEIIEYFKEREMELPE